MAPCCNNIVTPRMIKSGNVSIGDKIQLDEDITETCSNSDAALSSAAEISMENPVPEISEKDYIDKEDVSENSAEVIGIPGGVINKSSSDLTNQNKQDINSYGTSWHNAPIYSMNAAKFGDSQVSPLPYSQMTSYMNNVSIGGTTEKPSIITPQDPMTPDGYNEEIDYDTVQALNGFLRTQIGRYMRIEQLVGSNTIQDRYGFLVGVGSNYIILQEITTGNIMVLDIFSVRLTYVYYSPPVIPNI